MIQIDRLLFIAVLVSAFAAAALAGVPGTIFAFGVSPNGGSPSAELVADASGRLYGTTSQGGDPAAGAGVIFEVDESGAFSTLHKFGTVPNDGLYPQGALTLVGGKLYGTTSAGGEGAGGALFSLNVDGSQYQILHSFGFRGGDGAKPQTGLTLFDGALWGTTSAGGRGQGGTVYSILPDGGAYTVIFNFIPGSLIGSQPEIAVTFLGGQCFGVTSAGGANGDGSIFSLLPDGSQAAALHSFDRSSPANGYFPNGPLASGNGVLYGVTDGGGPFGPGIVYAIRADGSDFRIVHSFGSGQHTDGSEPAGSLLVVGGVIYGTTAFGGANDQGTIYSLADGGNFSILHSFASDPVDGEVPHSGLAVVSGGLAGTTLGGGVTHLGTAFSIQPDGSGYKQVFSFGAVNHDGWYPASGVIDVGGKLYGTTSSGGLTGAWGTVYSINKDGSGEQLLHEFDFDTGDGVFPSALVEAGGVLFGCTQQGGTLTYGTIFSINTDGSGYKTLHNFAGAPTDGWAGSALVLIDGALYGVSPSGFNGGAGTVFSIRPDGSDYRILHAFADYPDGGVPLKLVNVNGVLYGVTAFGGAGGRGTVFSIHVDGSGYQRVYDFLGATSLLQVSDGSWPVELIFSGGRLFGATQLGGLHDQGEVFSLGLDGGAPVVLVTFGDQTLDPTRGAYLTEVQGTLYGTAPDGGHNGLGGIFTVQPDGSDYQFIASFGDFPFFGNGGNPGLLLESDGFLYGVTGAGGAGFGTIFAISPEGTGRKANSFGGALSGKAPTPIIGGHP